MFSLMRKLINYAISAVSLVYLKMYFSKLLLTISICFIVYACGAPFICPDGYEMKDGFCSKCGNGTFRNGNMSRCRTFKTCGHAQTAVFPGNITHDVVCGCTDPEFPRVEGDLCVRDNNCSLGEYFVNGRCQVCPNGTWKNVTGPDKCFDCKQCNETIQNCSATMDTKCNVTADVMKSTDPVSGPLGAGAIAGIVLGIISVIVLIVVGLVLCIRRRKKKGSSRTSTTTSTNGSSWWNWCQTRQSAKDSRDPRDSDQLKEEAAPILPKKPDHEDSEIQQNGNPNLNDNSTSGIRNRDNPDHQNVDANQQNGNNNPLDANKINETSGQPGVPPVPVVVDPSTSSASHQPNPIPQNGIQNQPMVNENNSSASGIRDRDDPDHKNMNADQQVSGSQQNGKHNPKDASIRTEVSGIRDDPSIVVDPSTSSASLQPNPIPQNGNPNQPRVNDNTSAAGIRDHDDPGHKNVNADQRVSGSQHNPKDASKRNDTSGQFGGELKLKVDPPEVTNAPTSSVPAQPDPTHGIGRQSSLCMDPSPNVSISHVSVPGVAETGTTTSVEEPTGQNNLDLREDRSLPSGEPSIPPSRTSNPTSRTSNPPSRTSNPPSRTSNPPSQTSEGPENLWDYEDCIARNNNLIYTYLTSLDYILGSLLARGVFTHPQMMEIKEIEKNRKKSHAIDEMIQLMRLHGNKGFEYFIEALVSHDVKLDGIAKIIHPKLAERFIKERDSDDPKDPADDQKSKIEPPRNASSGDTDEVDYGRNDGTGETKIKTIDSGETNIKAIGSDETQMKAIGSDETQMKAIDSDETPIKAIGSDETKIKAIDPGETKIKTIDIIDETKIKAVGSGENQLSLHSVD